MFTTTAGRFGALLSLAVSAALASGGCGTSDAANSSAKGQNASGTETCPECAKAGGKATTAPTAECEDCGPALPVTAPATRPATNPTTRPDSATQPAEANWRELFDGKSIKDNWRVADFVGHGEIEVKDGVIVMPAGETLTGVTYTGADLPKMNYEAQIVARKTDGVDFFCGVTFPVGDSFASLICGGWGGTVVGISSINDEDAAHNETTQYKSFKAGQWYTVTVRVEPEKIQARIDGELIIDVSTKGKKVSLRNDINEAKPFGVAAFATAAEVKAIRVRPLDAPK